jgi:hypothetical protein
VVVTGAFYASLAAAVPGVDPNSQEIRAIVQPLNPPRDGTPPEIADAAREASTEAFHLAAIVCAVLLVAGAGTNWYGLRQGIEEEHG